MGLLRGSGVGGSARELIDDCLAERGQAPRRGADDQVAVNGDFLVYNGGASIAKVGAHAGIRRERAIPDYVGSTRVHGPWRMAATGLPDRTKSRTKATADSSSRNLSGLTVPPGSTRASNSSTEASATARSTGNVPAGSRSCSRARTSPVFRESN